MTDNISNTARFMSSYNYLLQQVKSRWIRSDCKMIGISESKASRVFNGQFDILTLLKMAAICGIELQCHTHEIKQPKSFD